MYAAQRRVAAEERERPLGSTSARIAVVPSSLSTVTLNTPSSSVMR
jgi:hypothetical protein